MDGPRRFQLSGLWEQRCKERPRGMELPKARWGEVGEMAVGENVGQIFLGDYATTV